MFRNHLGDKYLQAGIPLSLWDGTAKDVSVTELSGPSSLPSSEALCTGDCRAGSRGFADPLLVGGGKMRLGVSNGCVG